MTLRWTVLPFACLALAVTAVPGAAQAPRAPGTDSVRALVLEHEFTGDRSDSVVAHLERHVFYLVEVSGSPGTPVAKPLRNHRIPALVVSTGQAIAGTERFEMHTGWSGPYAMTIEGMVPGSSAVLRLYRNESATERAAVSRDRELAMGVLVAGGLHSGYRLDPTGGEPPAGGGDIEICALAESGGRFGACLGGARQSFPDADFAVTWFFLEPRVRLLSGAALGGSLTDVGISIRIGQGVETGPRHHSPSQIALGLYVVQHLAKAGFRRGWSLHAAYHRGWLGNVPETEFRVTDRFMAGLALVP